MNVSKICSLGYFDRVLVDGYTIPMFSTRGIEIKNEETLIDSININMHGVGKIRVTVYGESTFNLEDDNLLGMRWHREQKLKLSRTRVDDNDRYAIAYVDLLILKSNLSLLEDFNNKEKSNYDITKLVKSEDEIMLLSKALEMQIDIWSKSSGKEECNIAIVDRVYVNKHFRNCGISKWIHLNILDIIKTYGMISVSAVLLIPGDFSDEAEKVFGLSKREYRDMLIKHYKSTGYKFIDKYIMCKYQCVKKHIFSINKVQNL